MAKNCDIIIPVHNQFAYTKICLESILAHTKPIYRLIVIDDCSSDETAGYLADLAGTRKILLFRNKVNLGWVGSVNLGLRLADAEYVCVMNNDTRAFPGWLSEMISVASLDKLIGLVNPCWELPKFWPLNFQQYFNRIILNRRGDFVETDWARGFCFLIKKNVLEKIGGLNEAFAPGYYDDWDYSLRAVKAGFIPVRARGAFVRHFGNVTYKKELGDNKFQENFNEKKRIFEREWGRPLRILFIWEAVEKKYSWQINDFVLRLLRAQHKLLIITNKFGFSFKHTNCGIKKTPIPFIKIMALACLLDNFKRALSKRYNMIVCSADTKAFLEEFTYVRDNFSFMVLNGSLNNAEEAFSEIERLKRR